jgi:hypothetical protein
VIAALFFVALVLLFAGNTLLLFAALAHEQQEDPSP